MGELIRLYKELSKAMNGVMKKRAKVLALEGGDLRNHVMQVVPCDSPWNELTVIVVISVLASISGVSLSTWTVRALSPSVYLVRPWNELALFNFCQTDLRGKRGSA